MKAPLAGALLVLAPLLPLRAQPSFAIGAEALVLATRASPMPVGRARTELLVVQPVLMADATIGPLRLTGMVDAEGWTMPGGHLSPGAWGEGFNDRRHPHTYLHELTAAVTARLPGPVRASLTAGKGFAPFGTDDPMSRPAVAFPVNHHWSQVLERAVIIGAVEAGPVTLEAGWFNGDEPVSPSGMPLLRGRFGDSWAVRAFARPGLGLELQASRASVLSPEHRSPPAGPRHEKLSASARLARAALGGRLTSLIEYARNDEFDGFFVYHSWLAEAELRRGPHRPYVRAERTERPEEERLADPFRSVRPHFENSNQGTSRWLVFAAGYGVHVTAPGARARIELIGEIGLAHVTMVTPGAVFSPEAHFGGNDLVTVNVGIRIGAGSPLHRMGRYGVVAGPAHDPANFAPEHTHP